MSRPTTSAEYRPHLDGIRALAVVAVIVFHLGYQWIPGGFVGVDVFFVLSGYLITGLLLREATTSGTVELKRFYARRARRLLPAAICVLVVVIVLSNTLLDAVGQQTVGHDVTWSALYSANWRFAAGSEGYFTPGDVPSPVVHFWSLAVEEQFYLVWPLLFLGLWRLSTRRRGRDRTGFLLAAMVVLSGLSAWRSVVEVPSTAAYYGTHTRAYQLIAGGVLALVAARWGSKIPTGRPTRAAITTLGVASLALLAWLSVTIADASNYPGVAGLWVTAASLGLVVGVDLGPDGWFRTALGAPPIAALGRLSYSLYLWHWPLIVFAPVAAVRWGAPVLAQRWALASATVALALISYFVIERPVRFRLVPAAPKWMVISVGLLLSSTVAAVGIPFLQPQDSFATEALAAVGDSAPPGRCPYFREQWGSPSTSEPCVYRQGGPFTVALVGDSHAQQWQPAIAVLAERYDLTVLRVTRRGCPVNAITVQSFDDQGLPHSDLACTQWRNRVYAQLIDRYDPDLVYAETRSHEWAFESPDGTISPTNPEHLSRWAEAWGPSLDVLTSGTGKVVVSETLPNIEWRVPACLADHRDDPTACDMPLANDSSVVPYNEAIRALADHHDVAIVNPTSIVCPDGTCPARRLGEIVHRDDDHLTASFAAAATDEFEAMLVAAGVRFPSK